MDSYLLIVFRSIVVYFFIIISIRIFGKKELAQLSVIDLVFILLISNSVQNAMVGQNSSLVGGLTAALSLFCINWILKNIFFKSKKISQAFQGSPVMLVYEGKILEKHLKKMEITREELEEAIREHGIAQVEDVNLAVLEIDGTISVLSDNYKKKIQKKRRLEKYLANKK
jgi:uncharacterized membrane protein YcaP (DUF421 family)